MDEVGAVLFTGVMGAAVALWGIFSQRAIARRQTTLELLTSNNRDNDLIRSRKKFIELAKSRDGLASWAAEEKESTEEVQAIRLTLNQFELISIGIQRGVIDFELYKRWFRSGVITYWDRATPFIQALRARTSNPMIYHEFEALYEWMKEGSRPPRRFKNIGKWF